MKKNPLDTANDLITHFISVYKRKFSKKPVVNRGKLKYGLAEVLQDWTEAQVKEFIEYYVKSNSDPDLADFYRRYDEIIKDKEIEEKDAEERKQLLNETQKSVIKFRETYKNAK